MNVNLSLRTAFETEGETLASIRVEAMRESLERIGRFDEARTRTRFLSTFAPAATTVALVDGEVAGFFVVKTADGLLLLDHLYILPRFQRRGIGTALLAAVLAEADARGLPLRVGAVRESEANAFYLRHGFMLVERAEHDNYYLRSPRLMFR